MLELAAEADTNVGLRAKLNAQLRGVDELLQRARALEREERELRRAPLARAGGAVPSSNSAANGSLRPSYRGSSSGAAAGGGAGGGGPAGGNSLWKRKPDIEVFYEDRLQLKRTRPAGGPAGSVSSSNAAAAMRHMLPWLVPRRLRAQLQAEAQALRAAAARAQREAEAERRRREQAAQNEVAARRAEEAAFQQQLRVLLEERRRRLLLSAAEAAAEAALDQPPPAVAAAVAAAPRWTVQGRPVAGNRLREADLLAMRDDEFERYALWLERNPLVLPEYA